MYNRNIPTDDPDRFICHVCEKPFDGRRMGRRSGYVLLAVDAIGDPVADEMRLCSIDCLRKGAPGRWTTNHPHAAAA